MAATVCIQVNSAHCPTKQVIDFFSAGEWTTESEVNLIQRTHALLSTIRPFGKTLHLTLNVEVCDVMAAVFLIQKKINTGCLINNQKLSVRESEIIGLIIQGFTNKDIAKKLFISYQTVKTHRKNILFKTGAINTAGLISYYHQAFFNN